jgi:LCP family protein required for cell wall assembly
MKKKFLNKKNILIISISVVAVLLAIGGIALATTLDKILNNPIDLFSHTLIPSSAPAKTPTAAPTPSGAQETPGTTVAESTPTPSLDPYDALNAQADQSIAQMPVNILLIGVDWEEDRVNSKDFANKRDFNSDVMLLLAIDFKQNKIEKVDMINFPRDSYAKIHNMPEGTMYKMNFALAAGTGMNNEGFMNVCKTVQDELGGSIPVDYYIAVTMPAVKKLVDEIGGIDYVVDIDYRIGDRPAVKKGLQHMDGQMVLDYCRVRKSSGTGYISTNPGDLNRVKRQRNMLLAIFKKLQNSASLANVPKLLSAVSGCQTNLSLPQMAAIAVHAKGLDPDKNIKMYTMGDKTASGIFNYNFVLVSQPLRLQIIKDVFGISVAPQYRYAPEFAHLQWAYMQGAAWSNAINHVLLKDLKLPEAERKIIDPDLSALTTSVSDTLKLMSKYYGRLYKDSKPVVQASEWNELDKQVKAMKNLGKVIFAKTGYITESMEAYWHVNVPELLKMSE